MLKIVKRQLFLGHPIYNTHSVNFTPFPISSRLFCLRRFMKELFARYKQLRRSRMANESSLHATFELLPSPPSPHRLSSAIPTSKTSFVATRPIAPSSTWLPRLFATARACNHVRTRICVCVSLFSALSLTCEPCHGA